MAAGIDDPLIPTSTRILDAEAARNAFLLRGHGMPGVNRYAPRPRFQAARHMPFTGSEQWR